MTIKTTTKINTITESELRSEIIIEFNDLEDEKSCIISFSERLQKFVIEFNCELIHSSKIFKSMINKLDDLVEKHQLTEMTIEQF